MLRRSSFSRPRRARAGDRTFLRNACRRSAKRSAHRSGSIRSWPTFRTRFRRAAVKRQSARDMADARSRSLVIQPSRPGGELERRRVLQRGGGDGGHGRPADPDGHRGPHQRKLRDRLFREDWQRGERKADVVSAAAQPNRDEAWRSKTDQADHRPQYLWRRRRRGTPRRPLHRDLVRPCKRRPRGTEAPDFCGERYAGGDWHDRHRCDQADIASCPKAVFSEDGVVVAFDGFISGTHAVVAILLNTSGALIAEQRCSAVGRQPLATTRLSVRFRQQYLLFGVDAEAPIVGTLFRR